MIPDEELSAILLINDKKRVKKSIAIKMVFEIRLLKIETEYLKKNEKIMIDVIGHLRRQIDERNKDERPTT